MNVALWVVQAVLGLIFLVTGTQKAFRPLDAVARTLPWVEHAPPALVRFIGTAEVLGGIGLILPAATHILPWLTIWAGVGLAVAMVLATAFHLGRREYSGIALTLVLLALAVFVAIGRWQVMPL